MNPTHKQRKILNFIENYYKINGSSPSYREIANHCGVSVGTVQDQLESLKKRGTISITPGRARSINLVNQRFSRSTQFLPLLGVISAGEGITIFEEPTPELISVPSSMLSPYTGYFCLKINGFSMMNDGILDGDYVVVKQQSTATDGDTVIAVLIGDSEEKATIKRFYHHGHTIELRPRNQALKSRFYDPSNVVVRGKFCGLIRREN